jgi:hypothetical protein
MDKGGCHPMREVTCIETRVSNKRAETMKLRYLYPLFGFILPTVVIGYGFVIPRSCIAGINDLTIGFTVTLMSACITYWIGLRNALRDVRTSEGIDEEMRIRIILEKEENPLAPSRIHRSTSSASERPSGPRDRPNNGS